MKILTSLFTLFKPTFQVQLTRINIQTQYSRIGDIFTLYEAAVCLNEAVWCCPRGTNVGQNLRKSFCQAHFIPVIPQYFSSLHMQDSMKSLLSYIVAYYLRHFDEVSFLAVILPPIL